MVLNTPASNSMLLYYSRKLAYYNLSVFKNNLNAGYCYLWSEVDGLRGSNEISTIIFSCVKSVDGRGTIHEVALYCDSCPGQNKNHKILFIFYKYFLSKYSKNFNTISMNYLIPDHT